VRCILGSFGFCGIFGLVWLRPGVHPGVIRPIHLVYSIGQERVLPPRILPDLLCFYCSSKAAAGNVQLLQIAVATQRQLLFSVIDEFSSRHLLLSHTNTVASAVPHALDGFSIIYHVPAKQATM